MAPAALFGISTGFSLIAWGIASALYLWPHLRGQKRSEAMRPLLLLHSFRFVGLAFLVPGVVSPDLPAAWAGPAAYGDLVAAVLALLALAGLESRLGMILVWLFNLWGSADLLYAFYQDNQVGLEPGQFGAGYFHCDRSCATAAGHTRLGVLVALERRLGNGRTVTWSMA
jgi:hypothetical protein